MPRLGSPGARGAAHSEGALRGEALEEGERHDRAGDGNGPDGRAGAPSAQELDSLDPAARHAAHLAPPMVSCPIDAATLSATEPVRARTLEELLPMLVRRIAWAGDRHKGTVRLELGGGVHAGTTVTVHADGGRVRVELGGAEGAELDGLRARLDARLRRHGLDVESVT